jgi:hypothetical protein
MPGASEQPADGVAAGARSSEPLRLPVGVARAIERLLGSPVVAFASRPGGYTRAVTGRVMLRDGRAHFVKTVAPDCPPDDPLVEDLVHERDALLAIAAGSAGSRVPAIISTAGGPSPLIVLEDLSAATWPPPYPDDLRPLVQALRDLSKVVPPPSLPALADEEGAGGSWHRIADDRAAFLGIGLVDGAWLDRALPALVDAEGRVQLAGNGLVHGDLWYANLCFAPRGPVIVDWGSAMRGNPVLDRATLAMDLVIEGRDPGPLDVPDLPAWLAFLAGHLAREATLAPPPIVDPDSALRADQAADVGQLLPVVVTLLDLPPLPIARPDGTTHRVPGTVPPAHTPT